MTRFRLTAPKRPRLAENDVERACLDLLRLRGYWIVRQHAGLAKTPDGRRWIHLGDKGLPDYAAVHAVHRGFLLEVKRPGQVLSADQVRKHEEIRVGYRVAICVVDNVSALPPWLALHELEPKGQSTSCPPQSP